MEERETDRKTIIGGDFNARTGKKGGSVERDIREEEVKGRESKDEKINKDEKKLISWIERGWIILNGGIRGDKKGEYTYTERRGESVIDYVVIREEDKEEVRSIEIGDNVELDQPTASPSLSLRPRPTCRPRSRQSRSRGGGRHGE